MLKTLSCVSAFCFAAWVQSPAPAPAPNPAQSQPASRPIVLGVGGAPKLEPAEPKPSPGQLTLEQLRQAKITGKTNDGTEGGPVVPVNPFTQPDGPKSPTGLTPPPGVAQINPDRPPEGKEPKFDCEKLEHEFGEILEGREVVADFAFKNSGKGPLVIYDAHPGCGCTNPYIEVEGKPYNYRTPIGVNAKGIVRLTLRSQGFGGVDKHTQVDVFTNDPSLPITDRAPFGAIALKLHANIIKPIVFEEVEAALRFGSVPNSVMHEGYLTLKSAKDTPFQVLGFQPMDPNLDLRAEPIDAEAKRWRVHASILAGAPIGTFMREVQVLTNPETLSTKFSITADVRGPVEIDPQMVSFLTIQQGRVAAKTITILNHHPTKELVVDKIRFLDPNDNRVIQGDPAAREDASSVKDHLIVRPVEKSKGKAWNIEIVVKETMPKGAFNTWLAFDSGVPGGARGQQEIRIPLSGVVR